VRFIVYCTSMLKVQFEFAGSSECSDVIVLVFVGARLTAARHWHGAFINVVGTAVLCTPSDWAQRIDADSAGPRASIQNGTILASCLRGATLGWWWYQIALLRVADPLGRVQILGRVHTLLVRTPVAPGVGVGCACLTGSCRCAYGWVCRTHSGIIWIASNRILRILAIGTKPCATGRSGTGRAVGVNWA